MNHKAAFGILLVLLNAAVPSSAEERHAQDRQLLKDAGQAADGPALLEFFRQRTIDDTPRRRLAVLIQQLGDDDFETREKASREIVALGPVAQPALSVSAASMSKT